MTGFFSDLAKAHGNLDLLGRTHADGIAVKWLRNWRDILGKGIDTVLEALTSRSPVAVELRQNSPFAGVLPTEERQRALAAFRSHCLREHAVDMEAVGTRFACCCDYRGRRCYSRYRELVSSGFLSAEWVWPGVEWEEFSQLCRAVPAKDYFCVQVAGVDLADEFAASSAGRQHIKGIMLISPHRDNFRDSIFPRGDHSSDGTMLRTEAGARTGIDADTRVAVSVLGDKRRPHVPKETITHNMGIDHALR